MATQPDVDLSVRIRHGTTLLPPGFRPESSAELRCSSCGYGAVGRAMPVACPMCGARTWDLLPWRPEGLGARL